MYAALVLDFDGVMGAGRVWSQNRTKRWTCPAGWIDPVMIARLNRLVRRTSAGVVISTSWRRYLGPRAVEGVLRACGFTGTVLGATPVFGEKPEDWRAEEIAAWLAARPGIQLWAALDDLDLDIDPEHFVRTQMLLGLTDDDCERVARILGAP